MSMFSRFLAISILLFHSISSADDLHWTGCGVSKKGFMQAVADEYEKHSGVKVRLSGGGATKGIRLTQAGRSDMGGSCRHQLNSGHSIIKEEKDILLIPVAWDALVVLVSQYNPIESISIKDLTNIFSGEVNNWKEVGGNDEQIIRLVRKSDISGVGHMARILMFYDKNMYFKREFEFKSTGPLENWFEIDSVVPKVRQVIIQRKQKAIALDGYSSARKISHKDVKMIKIDGVLPGKESIQSGEYPYIRPLYIAIRKDKLNDDKMKQFIDYVISNEGQSVISNSGTVSFLEGKQARTSWNTKADSLNLKQIKENMSDYLSEN